MLPETAQGVPSGLTQPGSAAAVGAARIAVAAAPARRAVVREIFLHAMRLGIPEMSDSAGPSG